MAEEVSTPHCHVPASFDPEQREALRRHLARLVGAIQWLEREVSEQRECHATLAQGAVVDGELRTVIGLLVDGHLRHCVLGAVEQGQRADEIAGLLAPLRSVLFPAARWGR